MEKFLKEVKRLTDVAMNYGDTAGTILQHLYAELGEVSECIAKEQGSLSKKYKELKETSKEEMVDVIQNAFSVFFALGGDVEFLTKYGAIKNKKWHDAQIRAIKLDEINNENSDRCSNCKYDYNNNKSCINNSWHIPNDCPLFKRS